MSLWDEYCDAVQPGDICVITGGSCQFFRTESTLYVGKTGKLERTGEFTMLFSETPNMSRVQYVPDPSNPSVMIEKKAPAPPQQSSAGKRIVPSSELFSLRPCCALSSSCLPCRCWCGIGSRGRRGGSGLRSSSSTAGARTWPLVRCARQALNGQPLSRRSSVCSASSKHAAGDADSWHVLLRPTARVQLSRQSLLL